MGSAGRHAEWRPGRPVRMTSRLATRIAQPRSSSGRIRRAAMLVRARHSAGTAVSAHDPGCRAGGGAAGTDHCPGAGAGWSPSTRPASMSRRQLYALGVTRAQVRAQVRARRWQRWRTQSVCLHYAAPLDEEAKSWVAVFEGWPARPSRRGVRARRRRGCTGFTVDRIRVSVPRGSRVRRTSGLDIRQTRRWSAEDIVTTGHSPCPGRDRCRPGRSVGGRSDKQARCCSP